MIDLILHAADQATALDWFQARDLIPKEIEVAETDAEGAEVTRTVITAGTDFQWVKYGSGVVYSTPPTVVDGETTDAGTVIPGIFFACRFPSDLHIRQYAQDTGTKTTLAGIECWEVDTVKLIRPGAFESYLQDRGLPLHTWLGGAQYSDPEVWVQQTYMEGDEASFDGKTWVSLMDYNVWAPPIGWRETVTEGYPDWVQPTGAHDAYAIGDEVQHPNAQDDGKLWLFRSKIAANVTVPGTDGTFHRWWEPVRLL